MAVIEGGVPENGRRVTGLLPVPCATFTCPPATASSNAWQSVPIPARVREGLNVPHPAARLVFGAALPRGGGVLTTSFARVLGPSHTAAVSRVLAANGSAARTRD